MQIALMILATYLMAGGVFALVFHLRGLHSIDPATEGAGIAFRLLITPGIIALWPLIAARWRHAAQGRVFQGSQATPVSSRGLRSIHAIAWKGLGILMPLILAAVLWNRPPEIKGSPVTLPKIKH